MQYYTQIKDNKDIEELMDSFGWFHDSCIKELEYYSGSYVDSNRCMYPFNSSRCVRMVFQSQNTAISTIEMKFDKIKKLNLIPRNEEYDCIIYGASLKKIDGLFYWSEWTGFKIEDITREHGTWISAQEVSWRPLRNALGEERIYNRNKKADMEKKMLHRKLKRIVDGYGLIEKSQEMFWATLKTYQQEDAGEFNIKFNDYDKSKIKIYIKSVSFSIINWPSDDYDCIKVSIGIEYNNKNAGYHDILYRLDGEIEDDYFVIY